MNSKKAITLLVLATLLMGLLPVLPARAGITNPIVETVDVVPTGQLADGVEVVYDETYAATGSGVSPGQNIEVYWDLIQAWDGEAGLLNTSKGLKDGTFEIWFNIPEAVNGDHYIWVRDVSTGETVKAVTAEVTPAGAVMVAAYVELDPDSGLEDDEITINGYGYSSEAELVPTLILIMGGGLGAPAEMDLSPSTPETDEVGSWTATWIVPDDAAYTYANYDIYAEDEDGVVNPTAAVFTIGSSVTTDVEEGPTGTVVEAEGRGFTNAAITGVNLVTETAHVLVSACEVTDNDDLDISGGEFTLSLVIPSNGALKDDYEIQFTDGAETAYVDFEITGLPEIETSPDYGIQGETLVVEGWNYTAIADEEVEVFLQELGGANPESLGTAELDNDGHFEEEFTIPGIDSDTYEVFVEAADWNIDNQEQLDDEDGRFKVGLMIAIVTPKSGPSGTDVHITANGFDGNAYDLNFSDIVIFENEPHTAGASISDDFFVPTMAPGEYTITLKDDGTDGSKIFIETMFTVTLETYVETSPMVAPNEYNVSIMGYGFPDDEGSDLEFLMYNDTHEWTLDPQTNYDWDDDEVTPPTAQDAEILDDGEFRAYFTVPDDDEISVGTYWINVTSEDDNVWARYEFQVVEKTVDIEPRKSTFAIGDTVAFDVVSSFAQANSFIEVYDPEGNLYWKTEGFDQEDWVKVGTVMRYPYYSQIASGNTMELLDDAPLGEWSWAWYDDPNLSDDELDSGTFTVVEAEADLLGEQVADLNNQITDLASQISDVSSEFDDVKSDIADVAAIAEQAVAAAQQAAEAVQTVAQTANTASQAAEDAATAAEAARDAANGLTTLVYGAIGAALVAALAAIVSLMQISRRIAG